jgi:mannose-6-phosphate isomerase-like protein (cupin superfamily)
MGSSSFPGGASLSHLDIYRDAAPYGVCGGSPHMHLVSTEAYIVTSGTGALHTIDGDGYRETPLSTGDVVWFTPGTIHRAVNHDALQAIVLMSNAGLPEAGDAVMTFPADVVADADAYAAAASLEGPEGLDTRAAQRRDLAVIGFLRIRDALLAGDHSPLDAFRAAAGALVRTRAAGWTELIRERPLAQAARSLAAAEAVAAGDVGHLRAADVQQARRGTDEAGFGMCGRLRPYDVSDGRTRS